MVFHMGSNFPATGHPWFSAPKKLDAKEMEPDNISSWN